MSAEPDPAKAPPGEGRIASWRRFGPWFNEEWKRTPVISWLILLVACISLLAACLNYRLQKGWPKLEPTGGTIVGPRTVTVHLGWLNIGKQTARGGWVELYAADNDGRRLNKLGEGPVGQEEWGITTGASVLPGAGRVSNINSGVERGQWPNRVLFCVVYKNDDERANYRSAFRYRVRPLTGPPGGFVPPVMLLEEDRELPPPSPKICR
jgi:hypothetical protein